MRIERFDSSIGVPALNKELTDIRGLDFLHVRHKYEGLQNLNMISISRRRPEFRETLRILTGQGFHLYKLSDETSSFVSFPRIQGLWSEVESGKLRYNDKGIPYTWNAASVRKKDKILVIFASIATKSHQSSLKRHFEHNFASLGKYVAPNTHVMRIADLGGVGGGWYIDTNFLTKNFVNIQALILEKCGELGIDISDAVFYGVSKGATAALIHAMDLGAKAVAVDPIVSDHLYADVYDDLHFTLGNFPKTKDEIFEELSQRDLPYKAGNITVLYSDMSPQFSYINEKLLPWTKGKISYVNVSHPDIKDHPDVGPCSMSTTVMLINMKLHGLAMPIARLDAPFGPRSV